MAGVRAAHDHVCSCLIHRECDVSGIGHDGDRMLTSPCGLAALFGIPAAAQQ